MKIVEIISRYRNDFKWIGQCSHCGHRERYGDGYADHFYCTRVAPGRYCPKCDLNCFGERAQSSAKQVVGESSQDEPKANASEESAALAARVA